MDSRKHAKLLTTPDPSFAYKLLHQLLDLTKMS